MEPMPDLRNFIIVGDIDISGYKGKIEESVSSILPYAVTNKLYCSGWDRNLFNIIKKLPYAETIDCSMSIKDLGALKNDDGSYKLPIGLKNLVVQSSIIVPDAFLSRKKDYQQQYLDYHNSPPLSLTAGPLAQDLQISVRIPLSLCRFTAFML